MNVGFRDWVCSFLVGSLVACGGLSSRSLCAEDAPAPGGAQAEAQRLLEKQAADEKKLREEMAVQATAQYEAGKRLYEDFDYEGAQKSLELAIRLDPNHTDASKLLTRVNDVLGVRRDRIKSAVAQLYGEHKIMIQAQLVELDNKIDWAKRYMAEAQSNEPGIEIADRIRKFEQATVALERCRELIKWMPVDVSTGEQKSEVTRLLSQCRTSIKALAVRLQEQNQIDAVKLAEEQKALLKKEEQRTINMMVDQASNHYETGRYDDAVVIAKQILERDPSNPEANRIIATAKDKRYESRRELVDNEYKHHFELNRERAERMNIPHSDYLIYPPNWNQIVQRTSQESAKRTEEGWKQDIRKQLTRRVTFEFVETPLAEAINFLRTLTKVNIIIDQRIQDAANTPITLKVQEMEMETALRWILRLAELDFDLQKNVVFITKTGNLQANTTLQIYDVRDLTNVVTDFPGPPISQGAGASAAGPLANPFEAAPTANSLQTGDLAALIKDRLLPNDFADAATTSIEESGGKLVVMQRAEVHDKIRTLLQSFRDTQTLQVLTQVRFIDVTDGFLETIGVHFTGLDAAPGSTQLPNAAVDPLRQPSVYGLFPNGGGPGGALPSDIQPSPAFQFQDFIARPPFKQDFGAPSGNPGPRPITLLRPRLDANFPTRGNANIGPANAPAGLRRQWYEKAFGSPILTQGQTLNLLRLDPLTSALGSSIANAPQQGLLMQFRFLQSVQANAVLQAVRKDQTADQMLAPKLMQFNNQRAHILVAQQRSYIRDYDVSGAVFDPVIGSFLTGVMMEVKPTVSSDKKYITLDVRAGSSLELTPPQIVFITNAGGDVTVGGGAFNLPIELPNLELRSINTTVTVPDNGTMLYSGLISDRKIDAKSGVPLLSDLPIIGRFFSTNNKERVRRNLLVLIHSKVILFPEEEARLVN